MNSLMILAIAIGASFFSQLSVAQREVINTTSNRPMLLGKGFNSVKSQDLDFCVEATPDLVTENEGGQKVDQDVIQIETSVTLEKLLDVKANAKIGIGAFSVSPRVEFLNSAKITNKMFYGAVYTKVRNSARQLKAYKLTPAAKELLADPKKFFQKCGDGFIDSVTTGGDFIGVFRKSVQNITEKRKLMASLKAKYLTSDAEIKTENKDDLKTDQNQLETRIFRAGGTSALPKASLESILEAGRKFPTEVSNRTNEGWSYAFTYRSYEDIIDFDPKLAQALSLKNASLVVEHLAEKFTKVKTRYDQLDDILENLEYYDIDESKIQAIQDEANKLSDTLNLIRKIAIDCEETPKEAEKCRFLTSTESTVPVTRLPEKKEFPDGNTALHQAVIDGDLNMVQSEIESTGSVIARNAKGETPYDLAKKLRNEGMIKFFRELFAESNSELPADPKDFGSKNKLVRAVMEKKLDLAIRLVRQGAKTEPVLSYLDCKSEDGVYLTDLVLSTNPKLNVPGEVNSDPPIFRILRNFDFVCLDKFLKAGASVSKEIRSRDDQSLLFVYFDQVVMTTPWIFQAHADERLKTQLAYRETLNLLAQAGIFRQNQGLSFKKDSLHLAALTGDIEIFNLVLREVLEESVELLKTEERSPLTSAAAGGNVEIISFFLKKGFDPNQEDLAGNLPLHYAVTSGQLDAVRMLLPLTHNPDHQNMEGMTPFLAYFTGQNRTIRTLPSRPVFNPLQNDNMRDERIAVFLLENNVNPNAKITLRSIDGRFVEIGALNGINAAFEVNLVKALIARGVNVDQMDPWGNYLPQSWLERSVIFDQARVAFGIRKTHFNNPYEIADLVKVLSDAKVKFNQTHSNGSSLYHFLATRGIAGGPVYQLIAGKTDVNSVVQQTGDTPLHVAVARNNQPLVEYLLSIGANKEIVNLARFKPYNVARENWGRCLSQIRRLEAVEKKDENILSGLAALKAEFRAIESIIKVLSGQR